MSELVKKYKTEIVQYLIPVLGGILLFVGLWWFFLREGDGDVLVKVSEGETEGEAAASPSEQDLPLEQSQTSGAVSQEIQNQETQMQEIQSVAVYVAGGVKSPGVYQLEGTALVADAVEAAGGLSEECDISATEQNLNLASQVASGMKIYIPKIGDEPQPVAEMAQTEQSIQPPEPVPDNTQDPEGKININTASQSQLMDLSGIGEVYSQKIIDNRSYTSTEDLVSKEVIPSGTYEKIKEYITI